MSSTARLRPALRRATAFSREGRGTAHDVLRAWLVWPGMSGSGPGGTLELQLRSTSCSAMAD